MLKPLYLRSFEREIEKAKKRGLILNRHKNSFFYEPIFRILAKT